MYSYLLLEIGEMGEMDEIVEMVEIGHHFAHFARATSLEILGEECIPQEVMKKNNAM